EPIKENEGFVRLFIADTSQPIDKAAFEYTVCQKMSDFTNDNLWADPKENKTLTLEHHMAAQRGGFSNFFNALYGVDKLNTGLLDGTLSGITFFSEKILPLISSLEVNNQFLVSRILNKYSPLMFKEQFEHSEKPKTELKKVKDAVGALYTLWENNSNPTLKNILKEISRSGLFKVPDSLATIADRQEKDFELAEDDLDPIIDAWDKALASSFNEFKSYVQYISDKSHFGTHQGIKGLEFPRVMVILDDDEARGFLFSYGKLFGAKTPTKADIDNQANGKETSIDRTRRLFYVTCSRAEESLAIIAYTSEPNKIKNNVLAQGWFTEEEITTL
ncbi:MAG TPA: ATP-dependent helicase, partial [Cellvibrionaceae bacterium]|nr:ATP-dependent helicase [Cellvibrionaceae bacterium]